MSYNIELGTNVDDHPAVHDWLPRRNIAWHSPENCTTIFADAPGLFEKLGKNVVLLL